MASKCSINFIRIRIILTYLRVIKIIKLMILTFFVSAAPSTNLVGKFTQSVRRIVQDVKDEGTSSGLTKEEVIETNERLRAVRVRLEESYDTAKKSLITLMTKYGDSKSVHNIFQRYTLLKVMIKVDAKIPHFKNV